MTNSNVVLEDYFRANYKKLVKKVSGRAETPENAEDIVMDAFTNGLKYFDTFDSSIKPLDVWFGVILSNCLKAHMQAENNYGMCEEFDEMLHEPLNMSQVSQDLIEKVKEEINLKTGNWFEVLDLYFNKGYSPMEINELVDIQLKPIKNYVSLFKLEIRKKYGEAIA